VYSARLSCAAEGATDADFGAHVGVMLFEARLSARPRLPPEGCLLRREVSDNASANAIQAIPFANPKAKPHMSVLPTSQPNPSQPTPQLQLPLQLLQQNAREDALPAVRPA
jgi:hypothetical protein